MKELIMKYDPGIKIALLFLHFTGFSYWIGALAANQVSITAIVVTIFSGFLLVIRELIKDGLTWLTVTEGVLTIVKVVLLITAFLLEINYMIVLLIVMLLGVLSAHLPTQIKNKKIIGKDLERNRF